MSFTDDFPDLAAESLGGAVLLANDEFFAAKENLLKPHAAEWREHEYTDNGKWMDGWETRRRREPGYDWAIVRLGLPGALRGVIVDTAFFRGNYPAECSLEGCVIESSLDLAALAQAQWTELIPRSALKGDSKNAFEISASPRVTHLRLNIFPDGGVARLRVHGEVQPDWEKLTRHGGLVDLAALENGARSLLCSDMFFGSRNNLLLPGRPHDMSSGWETRRRRGPGHDWNLVQLGAPGTLRRIEVDTTHFKGNAPGRVLLEAGTSTEDLRVLLPETKTQPHTRHFFESELRALGPVTHVRLNVFPDGGVARLRCWGEPEAPPDAALKKLNEQEPAAAVQTLKTFCGSQRWAEGLEKARPFEDAAALYRQAERAWWALAEPDRLEAFSAHPRIGDKPQGTDAHARWAKGEQGGTAGASSETLEKLAQKNREYFDQHGFVFLICATGKSAPEMLSALEERLAKPRAEELRTAAEEQAKILRLRIGKYLSEGAAK